MIKLLNDILESSLFGPCLAVVVVELIVVDIEGPGGDLEKGLSAHCHWHIPDKLLNLVALPLVLVTVIEVRKHQFEAVFLPFIPESRVALPTPCIDVFSKLQSHSKILMGNSKMHCFSLQDKL